LILDAVGGGVVEVVCQVGKKDPVKSFILGENKNAPTVSTYLLSIEKIFFTYSYIVYKMHLV
jgi:hypothetical protein